MSINPLTFGSPVYSPPFSVSSGDIDVMKLRSKETAPLSHESLDENFTNLANKVNEILGLNIDELNITSAGVISASNLGINNGPGITYSSSTGVFGHQDRPAKSSGWSNTDISSGNRRYISGLDFDSFGHVVGYQYRTLNFTGSGSVSVNQSTDSQVTISSSAYTSGSSPSFTNISGSKLTMGSGVELRESPHRADLLEVRSLTSGWGGIQITNNTSEHLWSLMSDGTTFGLYDDLSNEWSWQASRDAGHTFKHNNLTKLQTRTSGIEVTGDTKSTGQVRAKGWYTTDTTNTAGRAMEIGISGGIGYLMNYDRDSSAYGEMRLQTGNNTIKIGTTAGEVEITNNGTNYYKIWHAGNDGAGSGLDADKLDGLSSGSFVRSDANDTVTGLLTMSRSGECLRIRGSADTTSPYISFYQQDTRRAYIQFHDPTNTLLLYNDVYDDYLKIGSGSSGLKWNYSGVDYTVYHSGNLPSIPSVSSASQKIQDATGNYGSVKVTSTKGGYSGYALQDDWVFMSSSASLCGIYNDTDNEWSIICRQNAETELMHNGVTKFETTSSGAAVTGTLTASTVKGTTNIRADDNVEIIMGTSADFQMYHNGSNQYFRNYNHADGNIYFMGEDTYGSNRGLIYMNCDTTRPYVRLYEYGEERLRTTSSGITVSGEVTTSSGTVVTSESGTGVLTYSSGYNVTGQFANSQNEFGYTYYRHGNLVTMGFSLMFDNNVAFNNGYANAKWDGIPFSSSGDSSRFSHGFAYSNDNPRTPFAVTVWGNRLWIMSTTADTSVGFIYGQVTYNTG